MSAAICVRTVRAPVPMSAAVMRIVKLPSSSARPCAVEGARRAGYVDEATPSPVSQRRAVFEIGWKEFGHDLGLRVHLEPEGEDEEAQ